MPMEKSAEWLVLGLVVLATLSIGFEGDTEVGDDLEVTQISGDVTLSTRTSMNALGLDDYDRGAPNHQLVSSNGLSQRK